MPKFVHARNSDHGVVYRVWHTVSDQYESEEMTREQMREHLLSTVECGCPELHGDQIDKRLDRAAQNGTSEHDEKRNLNAPWD